MRCQRCESLVVTEVFVDYEAGGGGMSFLGYRCPMCGDILDATILRHRAEPCAPAHHHARRRRAAVLVDRRRFPSQGEAAGSLE